MSVTLTAAVDTFTLATEPDASHNTLTYLTVGSTSGQGFIYFPLTGIPIGATSVTATLRLYTLGSWGITPTVTVQAADSAWAASRVTYNTHPGVTGSVVTVSHATAADADLFQFDISGIVSSQRTSGNYGLVISRTDGGAAFPFYAHDDPTHPPTLELSWSVAPTQPTGLKPAGSRGVATRWPTVSADGSDVVAVQVQTDQLVGDFSAPLFDTGTVPAAACELDLSRTDLPGGVYGGLPTGFTNRQWRIRYQNSSSTAWSPWSVPAQMHYQPYPTVTLTNPSSLVYGIVTRSDPTVTWTVSGGTQKQFCVQVTRADDPLTVLHKKTVPAASTSYAVPDGVVLDSSPYVVSLAVTDTADREAVPGYPVEKVVTQQFTFQGTGALRGPDAMSAAQVGVSPFIALSWTRNNKPDAWQIRRDAEIVAGHSDTANLEPGDDGVTYTWTDYTAAGNTDHHYRVEAIVGDQTSSGSPSFDVRAQPTGIWVGDPINQIQTQILGLDEPSMQRGETSAVYYPLRGSDAIRVVQNQRGFEGDITGVLFGDHATTDLDDYRTMQHIRNNPTLNYVIAFPDLSFVATLSAVNVTPKPIAAPMWGVSFHFEQQGTTLWDDQGSSTDEGAILIGTYDYEEGTNGAAVTTSSPDVAAVSGAPKYATSAAAHGSLGWVGPTAGTAGGAGVIYDVPTIGQVSVYFKPLGSTGAGSLLQLLASGSGQAAFLDLGTSGFYRIANSSDVAQATSTTAVWTTGQWMRVLFSWTWSTGTITCAATIYASSESTIPTETFSATFASPQAPAQLFVGSGNAAKQTAYDSVRIYAGNSSGDTPLNPGGVTAQPVFSIPGSFAPTTATVSSQVIGPATINLAYSTTLTGGGDPSSPSFAGAQSISAQGLVDHNLTGLSPSTTYYAKLHDGSSMVGELVQFKTLPAAAGAWSMKIALTSCQSNQNGSLSQIAWLDMQSWNPDMIMMIGDFHYAGGHVSSTDWTDHLAKYQSQLTGLSAMRQTLARAAHVDVADDHEYSNNNGDTLNDPTRAQSIYAMQQVFPMFPLADPAAPAAKRGLYGSFMIGSKVQVVVIDGISLDRSAALDANTSAKTFLGATQDAWLRSVLAAPVAVNIIVSGKALLGTMTGSPVTGDYDKIWNYGQWRTDLKNWISSHTRTGGGAINVDWWGGDRHANAYVTKAANPVMPGHSALIGSGIEQHSLPIQTGESSYTASYGFTKNKDQPVLQYLQITLSDNGSGTITRAVKSREVHNTWTGFTTYPSGTMTDPATWTVVDGWSGTTYTDTWT